MAKTHCHWSEYLPVVGFLLRQFLLDGPFVAIITLPVSNSIGSTNFLSSILLSMIIVTIIGVAVVVVAAGAVVESSSVRQNFSFVEVLVRTGCSVGIIALALSRLASRVEDFYAIFQFVSKRSGGISFDNLGYPEFALRVVLLIDDSGRKFHQSQSLRLGWVSIGDNANG
ncbi:hypothetical protein Tco_0217899 [Tanacetum coccineum]